MKIKSYALSIYGASAFRIAVSVLPFILPLMFQIGFHLSAFASGLYLLALFAGDLSMKAIVIPVLRRWGFRRILIVNGVITACSVALCATLAPDTPPALIVADTLLPRSCRSLEFTCMTTLAYTEIPPSACPAPTASSPRSCSSPSAWVSPSEPLPCASSPTPTAISSLPQYPRLPHRDPLRRRPCPRPRLRRPWPRPRRRRHHQRPPTPASPGGQRRLTRKYAVTRETFTWLF